MEISMTTGGYDYSTPMVIRHQFTKRVAVTGPDEVVIAANGTNSWALQAERPAGYTCVDCWIETIRNITDGPILKKANANGVATLYNPSATDYCATGRDGSGYYYDFDAVMILIRSDLT